LQKIAKITKDFESSLALLSSCKELRGYVEDLLESEEEAFSVLVDSFPESEDLPESEDVFSVFVDSFAESEDLFSELFDSELSEDCPLRA
jgi:hypothetical protein